MSSSIGIKIANGEFYSIMDENSSIKKRLILTTVHDNQPSVQIDLFRSESKTMTDSQYIGSVVVENIAPRPKGEPSIEMVVSSNADGDIIADAIDLDPRSGGDHYVLSVSLKTLDETSRDFDLPDFELESSEEPPSGLYVHANKIRKKERRPIPWLLLIIIAGVILVLGLAAVWFFALGGKDMLLSGRSKPVATESVRQEPPPEPAKPIEPVIEPVQQPEVAKQPEPPPPPPPPPPPEPVKQPEVVKQPEPPPVIKAPAAPPAAKPQTARKRPPPPVASYKVPATIPKEGVAYTIRYGDTLWDIAGAFYRNPWLYPRIARHNNIRNPDLIISGRTIRIPPKN